MLTTMIRWVGKFGANHPDLYFVAVDVRVTSLCCLFQWLLDRWYWWQLHKILMDYGSSQSTGSVWYVFQLVENQGLNFLRFAGGLNTGSWLMVEWITVSRFLWPTECWASLKASTCQLVPAEYMQVNKQPYVAGYVGALNSNFPKIYICRSY